MKKYKDLFIDFDDTLYDTHGNACIALEELFEHFGLAKWFANPAQFYDEYWKTNVLLWTQYAAGEIDRDYLIVERFRRPLAIGVAADGEKFVPSREFCLEVSDFFLDSCSQKSGVIEGAHELMEHLRSKGYGLHLCSNGFHEVQYKKLKASRLLDFFDTIILSEDAGANKPSAQFFDYALQQSGAERASTLMIGDNFVTDIQGARSSGIDAMFLNRFPQNFTAPEKVEFEVNSLREIMTIL